jgi:hypothetical protein
VERELNSVIKAASIFGAREMKILTDDPDWSPEIYEARALAMIFVKRQGRAVPGSSLVQAVGNGLTVIYHPNRSPLLLTIDAGATRVLSVEWKAGDAWRTEIETYQSGPWKSRLQTIAHPRPWLERCRTLVTFTGSLPRQMSEKPGAKP